MRDPLRRLLPCVLLLGAVPAQHVDGHRAALHGGLVPFLSSAPVEAPDAAAVVSRSVGLHSLDGELWGTSQRYKVRFDADGFEFTPTLGASAPRNFPLAFRLESIGRGETFAPLRSLGRRHSELRVEYDHEVAIERYDLGLEGMEQSFVFAERPAGAGDLVVRGRIRTDLLVTPEDGGLRLERPGVGGFRIGKVTGIDARGWRVDGTIRVVGDVMELSLPAEFADRAALPFVLDPFVGSAFIVAGTSLLDQLPCVAFDATNDCYLVVWEVAVSGTDKDIFGQRLRRSGSALGGRIAIDVSTFLDAEADVANVNGHNAFVVVYTRNGAGIVGRTVNAGTGGVALSTTIAAGRAAHHSPAVGGDSVPPFALPTGSFVCVWRSDGDQAVLATRVTINIDLTLTRSGVVHTVAQGNVARPRISKSGGGPRRYAVVYERQGSPREVWAIVVDSNGAAITPETVVSRPFDGHTGRPAVDGDGTNWVASFESEEFAAVYSAPLFLDVAGNRLVHPSTTISSTPEYSLALHPCVVWTGGTALVGWHGTLAAGGFGASANAVMAFRCHRCEGASSLRASHPINGEVEGCSALSGGGPADDALVVWEGLTSSNSDVVARVWRSADGVVGSLGGGCGAGGVAHAVCARIGESYFHRLRGSSPNSPAFLVLSGAQSPIACGTCRVIPSLANAVTLLVPTDANGHAAVETRLTDFSLRGLTLFEQWLTFRPGAACAQFALDMSNALQVVIE